jgi:ABC-type branched-subunit amino acid transport system ATPase component
MSDIVLELKALIRRFGSFTAVDALTLSVNAKNSYQNHENS